MKSELRQIIEGVLESESEGQANLASEACREKMALEIEEKIKSKFHIFRINRVMTGGGGLGL
jgi:hypothetical protein